MNKHIIDYWRNGGDSFDCRVLDLIAKADSQNLCKLKLVFPELVEAWRDWYMATPAHRQEARMSTTEVCVDIMGVDVCLDVSYFYYPGWKGSRFEPPEDESIEIVKLMMGQYDVSNLLTDDDIAGVLNELVFDKLDQESETV